MDANSLTGLFGIALLSLLPACGSAVGGTAGSRDGGEPHDDAAAQRDSSPRGDAASDAARDAGHDARLDAAPDGPSTDNLLSSLTVSEGMLSPLFSPATTTFTTVLDPSAFPPTASFTIVPTADDPGARITVNGVAVSSGMPSGAMTFTSWVNPVDIQVESVSGAIRTYTIRVVLPAPLSGGTVLQPSAPTASQTFGSSLALSGNTLAVGAIGEPPGLGDSDAGPPPQPGQVYIFTLSGSVWTQTAQLQASNASPSDNFGASVALVGNTLVVGAPSESSAATGIGGNQSDTSAPGAGAAYVFTLSDAGWTQTAYVKASNTRAGAFFGGSVALTQGGSSGSLTLAVGSSAESSAATGIGGDQSDTTAPNAGAVYVYAGSPGGWSQQAYVKASNTSPLAEFGTSVALSGSTLAVGAPNDSSAAQGINGNGNDFTVGPDGIWQGAAYVFVSSDPTSANGGWAQQAFIKESHPLPYPSGMIPIPTLPILGNFGQSVALFGDALVVGAPTDSLIDCGQAPTTSDPAFNDAAVLLLAGSVYTYARSGATWTFGEVVQASAGATQVPGEGANNFLHASYAPFATGQFGMSVALSADRIVAGAPSSISGTGSTSEYAPSASAPWDQNVFIAPSDSPGFGLVVALSGQTLAVTSASPLGTANGVYVYTLP
jgi:trimeric autotransporter adhesin